MRQFTSLCLLYIIVLSLGCTQVLVRKDPSLKDKGIRYWRPKPYLFIGPAGSEPQASAKPGDQSKGGNNETKLVQDPDKPTITEVSNFTKVSMTIRYMPDYNEEYSIRMTPGLGIGKLDIVLQDGWNLTTVGIQQDQQTAAILNSVAGLISAVHGGSPAASKDTKNASFNGDSSGGGVEQIFDASRDVPLGFYEPIIATDQCGRKSLFGWRYVGFMPYAGCPVEPCIGTPTVSCDPHELWGIFATKDALRFQRLSEMEEGVIGYGEKDNRPNLNDKRFKLLSQSNPKPSTDPTPESSETDEQSELCPPSRESSERNSNLFRNRRLSMNTSFRRK
ncbi:hypothetical protein [Schlesneria paludicola]|uniref:hypothetical protein n=1 Tax=Schlesneria paludicola TaxID=360056 RepID=UPI0002D9EFE5|nr:hypothetical protein [Schlesneria paludicola]